MGKFKDLTGNIYGKLTVIKFHDWLIKSNNKGRVSRFLCQCSCGNEKVILGTCLIQGLTKSCGCLQKDITFKIDKRIKHSKIGGGFNDLVNVYKRGAKSRNLEFSLSEDYFKELTSGNCHYCGNPPLNIRKTQSKLHPLAKDYVFNGVDRVNSSIGYIKNNVVSCCHTCNMMKRSLPYNEFLLKIEMIYEKLIKNKLL